MEFKTIIPDRDSQFKLLPCGRCKSADVAYILSGAYGAIKSRAICRNCGTTTALHTCRHDAQAEWNGDPQAGRPGAKGDSNKRRQSKIYAEAMGK